MIGSYPPRLFTIRSFTQNACRANPKTRDNWQWPIEGARQIMLYFKAQYAGLLGSVVA
jgi:hypothetical protein